MIQDALEKNKDLQELLFIRGFLVSNRGDVNLDEFPFYGNWHKQEAGPLYVYTHKKCNAFVVSGGGRIIFLLGHAYNPFTMEIDENKILDRILPHVGQSNFYDYVDELTGIFVLGTIEDNKVSFLVDPSGMQSAYYGVDGDDFYITSHAQILGDICHYEMTPLARELVAYKWYPRVMGSYLPADMTQFEKVKRIVPDIAYFYENGEIAHKRFYPIKDLPEVKTQEEYDSVIKQGADILKKNMELVVKKWDTPWISLTGGIDSNTTFAAANGNYDKIRTFSYCSAEKETIDCDAAKTISERFNVPWTRYDIPENNDHIDRFDEMKEIIDHNNGYIRPEKSNEIRKRITLLEQYHGSVEVKSWTSETIRAYWYKHYGRKRMPKLSPKLYRNLYKIFLGNRKLAHKVDKVFKQYIDEFEYKNIPAQYPPADMHYNEVTWGSWGGISISEMKLYSDITIIYNNRRFLDLMFRVPLDKRISDQHHLDMKKYLNKDLFDMGIRVVNMKETKSRARMLNAIFTMNMILPY